jgi:hypothetical protein
MTMAKKPTLVTLFFSALLYFVPASAIAQVDYTEEDYATLTLSGASEIPQATQAMFHLYDNLIAHEIEEYGTPLHHPNLLSSFVGGSIVLDLEDFPTEQPLLLWSAWLLDFARYNLGYETGSPKDLQLGLRDWLGRAWKRYVLAMDCFWDCYWNWCLQTTPSKVAFLAAATLRSVGGLIALGGPAGKAIGAILATLSYIVGLIPVVLCLLICDYHFFRALFTGRC